MIILAIETSCDDTAIAIVEIKGQKNPRFNILSDIVSSQVKLHAKYGGVFPSLAKREHQKNLPIVLKKALRQGLRLSSAECPQDKLKNTKIDLMAVTVGPGLEPCLWAGINFAKELSEKINIPLIPVNHIEAHTLANLVGRPGLVADLSTEPAICLVVSGGHTQIVLMKEIGKYKILGETRDDAAGECFDKTARILGLSYPGGPAIAKMASQSARKTIGRPGLVVGSCSGIELPRPMIRQKNYDFSFSGLKTAVLYKIKSMKPAEVKKEKFLETMSAEIQQSIIDVLIRKTIKAAKDYGARTIILGGGVTANDELRKQFKDVCISSGFNLVVPPKNLSTDNAAMIAVAGYFHLADKTTEYEKIKADANLRIG